MTGKERIIAVLEGRKPDRLPWVPYIGVHGGQLIGCSAKTYMKDGDQLLKGLKAVCDTYKPDGLVIAFDLQLEAELLGCQLKWYEDSPPSVVSHPLSVSDQVPEFDLSMLDQEGSRLSKIIETTKTLHQSLDHHEALYGLVCGPLTLAAHLRGEKFMMDIVLNEGYVKELLAFTSQVTKGVARLYIESGADVIAVVDPMISQISPGHFSKLLYSKLLSIFDLIRYEGGKSALFVCGSVDKHLEVMCKTKPDTISIDEHTEVAQAYNVFRKHKIVLSGNVPVTTLMLHGTEEENIQYVESLGFSDQEGVLLASGCDLPYDTPIGTIKAISTYVSSL